MKLEKFNRKFQLDKSSINVDERTIDGVSLSSDAVVKHRVGDLMLPIILEHNPGSINVNESIPLLWNHDLGTPIGKVENINLDGNKTRATLRFSRNSKAVEVLQDIQDGFITDTSMEFFPVDWIEEGGNIRVTNWKLTEGSIVALGADQSVGLNRAHDSEDKAMAEENKPGNGNEGEKSGNLNVVAFESARRSGRIEGEAEAQRKMTDNIKQIDDLFAMPAYRSQAYQDLKMELIRTGKTFEQARDALLEMVGGNSAPLAGEHHQDTQTAAQRGGAGMQRTHVQAGEDTNDKFSNIVEKALLVRVGATQDKEVITEVRQSEYGDMLVSEMARDFLTRNHISTSGLKREQLIGKAMTRAIIGHGTSDFANVLENVANKSMLLGYEESPETWPMIARSISVPDFKSNSFVGLSEFGSLPEVKENGEYTYGTMSDRKESAQLATFGQLFSISRQALANDDLDSLGRAPRSMGRAASRTIGDKVYEILTSNPTLNQDATSLFDAAGHGNDIAAGSGAAPSVATLDVARVAMATQKDQASATTSLNIRLARLIVPVALETTSNILQAAENDPATGGSATGPNPNPFRGTFQVVADARLDDADPAEWFASADPNVTDTIGACFLNGQTTPFLEQQEKLEVDGLVYKVRIDCVALALDFRGLFRNDGN